MIPVHEFIARVRVEQEVVERWVAAGWLLPERGTEMNFSEVDLARARLIKDLTMDFGVNDEGISLILHLLDQMHGLRRSLREVAEELRRERAAMSREP